MLLEKNLMIVNWTTYLFRHYCLVLFLSTPIIFLFVTLIITHINEWNLVLLSFLLFVKRICSRNGNSNLRSIILCFLSSFGMYCVYFGARQSVISDIITLTVFDTSQPALISCNRLVYSLFLGCFSFSLPSQLRFSIAFPPAVSWNEPTCLMKWRQVIGNLRLPSCYVLPHTPSFLLRAQGKKK